MMKRVHPVILAAGRGQRMKSGQSKILHRLAGVPIVQHIELVLQNLDLEKIAIICNDDNIDDLRAIFRENVSYHIQDRPLGTAHALRALGDAWKHYHEEDYLLILCGDVPLITEATLKAFILSLTDGSSGNIITFPIDPEDKNYGRVVMEKNKIKDIKEYKMLDDEDRDIFLGNTGVTLVRVDYLRSYLQLFNDDGQEFYLTGIAKFLYQKNASLDAFFSKDKDQFIGVNSREHLMELEKVFQKRLQSQLMNEGVSFVRPELTHIEAGVEIGRDVIIHPFVLVETGSVIEDGTEIPPYTHVKNKILRKDN